MLEAIMRQFLRVAPAALEPTVFRQLAAVKVLVELFERLSKGNFPVGHGKIDDIAAFAGRMVVPDVVLLVNGKAGLWPGQVVNEFLAVLFFGPVAERFEELWQAGCGFEFFGFHNF